MAAQSTAEQSAPRSATTTSLPRLLGTLGMLASPFFFISFAYDGFADGDASAPAAMLGFVFALGWLAIVLGLRALNVAGTRLPARILLSIIPVTVAMACVFQILEAVDPGNESLLFTITDIAWPFSMLLLLITGIAAIRARVFDGWLHFTPLAAALWLPASGLMLALAGETAGLAFAAAHVGIGWFLMGYAVRQGGRLAAKR